MLEQGIEKILLGTGRGTIRRMVEGAHLSAASTVGPHHHSASLHGPPPRSGEDRV